MTGRRKLEEQEEAGRSGRSAARSRIVPSDDGAAASEEDPFGEEEDPLPRFPSIM